MTLNEFRDMIQKYGFKVWRNDRQITVEYENKQCAHIDLSKGSFAQIDTEKVENIGLDKRKALLSAVSKLAITPTDRRHEKAIARHNTNMYIREIECWNNGTSVIFTTNKEDSDEYITYDERNILDRPFGKAVSYEEIYSGK